MAETLILYGYIVIALVTAVEEAGLPLPIPGDGLLLFAGYLVSVGRLRFSHCLVFTVGGALLGASVLYWLARRGGRALVLRYGRYLRLREERLDQLSHLFRRLGPLSPGVSRLVPGLRIYTSALAGLALVPYPIFLANVAWACTLWAAAFLWLGNAVGAHWREYSHWSQQVTICSAVAVAIVVAGWWILRRNRHAEL